MSARPTFAGFDERLPAWLRRLERHNDKAWFEAHRDEYQALYLEPAQAFVAAVGALLPKGYRAEPKINGSIMRIHRDVRFSKDKSPYKPVLHLIFARGSGPARREPAFYFYLSGRSAGVAAGLFGFDDRQLARYREAVSNGRRAATLRRAIEKVRKAGPYELGSPSLKRVPRGFDPDDPNADLLRHKGLSLRFEFPSTDPLFTGGAAAFAAVRFAELRPLPDWLARNVG